MKKLLLIIDYQNDFVADNGSLTLRGIATSGGQTPRDFRIVPVPGSQDYWILSEPGMTFAPPALTRYIAFRCRLRLSRECCLRIIVNAGMVNLQR